MSYGHTFDNEMRKRLVKAVKDYEADPSKRSALNATIMEIQQPYIDLLDKIRAIVSL